MHILRLADKQEISQRRESVHVVEQFKYLGVVFNTNLTFKERVKKI